MALTGLVMGVRGAGGLGGATAASALFHRWPHEAAAAGPQYRLSPL